MPKNQPPKTFQRNEHGLIEDDGITYIFNEDGTINWRKMIPPEFLVVNKEKFSGKDIPNSIEGLEDKYLIILLGGIKQLAQIRGYESVNHTVTTPSNDYIASVCTIKWIPNYETEGRSISFSAIGDASPFNTNKFGKNYLGAIAENRAFVRSVRNFLKINIVGQDELDAAGSNGQVPETDTASAALQDVMKAYNVSFEKIKDTLIKDNLDGAKEFTKVEDIPKFKQFELIERIKKAFAKV